MFTFIIIRSVWSMLLVSSPTTSSPYLHLFVVRGVLKLWVKTMVVAHPLPDITIASLSLLPADSRGSAASSAPYSTSISSSSYVVAVSVLSCLRPHVGIDLRPGQTGAAHSYEVGNGLLCVIFSVIASAIHQSALRAHRFAATVPPQLVAPVAWFHSAGEAVTPPTRVATDRS